MSRKFFNNQTTQRFETKAWMISGGTDKERLDKMFEVLSEFKGAHITLVRSEQDVSSKDPHIANPMLFLIECAQTVSKTPEDRYEAEYIRQLAIQQGNVINLGLTPRPSAGWRA